MGASDSQEETVKLELRPSDDQTLSGEDPEGTHLDDLHPG
jgi:hypothetical protein